MRLISLFLVQVAISATAFNNSEILRKGVEEYFDSEEMSQSLVETLENIHLPRLFDFETVQNDAQCLLCNVITEILIVKRRFGFSRSIFALKLKSICQVLRLGTKRVCEGVIELNLDVFLYIVDHDRGISSRRICGIIFQSWNCDSPPLDWSVNIPTGTSPKRKFYTNADSFNVLHLSDIHFDPRYTRGGNADCGEPLCCQDDQGEPSSADNSCGFWSDYKNADAPWDLVEETIRQANTQNFDYVYYTGDIVSHRVWATSVENNSRDIDKLLNYFHERFRVPVFVVLGNHEPHPLNIWTSEGVNQPLFNLTWLFDLSYIHWTKLMQTDSAEVRKTISKGGYYTVLPRPGFRIIAINSNFCYTFNWWLIYNDFDPYGQLQWLAETLKLAEDNEESVHILGHVPTGSSECLKTWSREYRKIVTRFANTITGQFEGHTHRDEFHVFFDGRNETKAVGVSFNGASVTPYTDSNPSYKIFKVEGKSFSLLDYEEWTFNLTLANLKLGTPDWYKLYSFTEAYGVENLHADQVGSVLYKMARDNGLLYKYFRFYFRNGDTSLKGGCDDECQKDHLCSIATSEHGDSTQCRYFTTYYDVHNKK